VVDPTETVASLVDSNILIYRCDPQKREAAREVLRLGEETGDLRIPHQAVVEFMSVITSSRRNATALMTLDAATRQGEFFMAQFPVLYPKREGLPNRSMGDGGLPAALV
jgi:predicted nucleic acid-binding protein